LTASDAEAGKGMYRIYCSACHGIRAQGGRGPDLTRTTLDNTALHRIIAQGSPLTEMPAYGANLGDANVWRLVAYLRTAAQPAPASVAGDAATGEKLFWGQGNCGACHRVGERGSRVGPDLTLAGRTRSVQHLREAITDPDRDIPNGYATIVAVTKSGATIQGVERGFDNFSAQFLDAQGAYHSFLKDDVASLTKSKKSLMPAYRYSAADVNHLIVYLQSLGRKPQ